MNATDKPQGRSEPQVQEHIRLLRAASRSKLAVLTIAVIATWSLWGVLKEGEQAWLGVADKYNAGLSKLGTKYGIPPGIDFGIDDPVGEVMAKLWTDARSPFAARDTSKQVPNQGQFDLDLSALQDNYKRDVKAAVDEQTETRIDAKYTTELSELKRRYRIPADIVMTIDDPRGSALFKVVTDPRQPFKGDLPAG